ncbi:DUF4160 domain-containing protein [bacterium]|nr:DUF4160 domain-containing protein [bacterium]
MPTIHRERGFRFFFFSNDFEEKPHIHIESAGKYAKFWLEPIEISKNYGYNERELNIIADIIKRNKNIFLRRWNEYFN